MEWIKDIIQGALTGLVVGYIIAKINIIKNDVWDIRSKVFRMNASQDPLADILENINNQLFHLNKKIQSLQEQIKKDND